MNSSGIRKAIPTEYRGIRFRSKSEAIFARALDLAHSGKLIWEYEPNEYEVDGWKPDFYVKRQYEGSNYWDCIIELKPSEVTDTHMDNLGNRFCELMDENVGLLCYLICGNHRNSNRHVWWFNGGWDNETDDYFWSVVFSKFEEAAEYRFDLKH